MLKRKKKHQSSEHKVEKSEMSTAFSTHFSFLASLPPERRSQFAYEIPAL